MKEFNAKEIADATGLNRRTIKIKAKEQGWGFTLKQGMGGQIPHYAIENLPPEIAQKVAKHFVITEATESTTSVKGSAAGTFIVEAEGLRNDVRLANRQTSLEKFAGIQGKPRQRALAKQSVLVAINGFQKHGKLPKIKAIDQFCKLYNEKNTCIEPNLLNKFSKLSRVSILRWEKAYKKDGIMALVGNYGKAKGSGLIDSTPEMKEYCFALIYKAPHIKGQRIHELLKMEFGGKYQVPSPTTCRDWLKRWKEDHQSLYMSLFDPSGWQNSHMVAFGSKSANIERINQEWEFDSTPADVMLKEGRYSIMGVIDVFTRRVKLILKPTSNAAAISLLMRNALLDWGKPEIAVIDNGQDYLSEDVSSIWDALEITPRVTNPYSGWEKPFIERFFRTFSHGIAELLDGYIGHNVSDREKISKRLTFAKRLLEKREKGKEKVALDINISADEFQKFIDKWVNVHYQHTRHSELNCTPFEKFTQHQQTIKRIDNERTLDVLLAPIPNQKGFRKIGKEGISVDGSHYIHSDLGKYQGERVFCRYNQSDVGKIYVFHALHGHFICEAINPEIAGQDITMAHAREATKAQRAGLAAQRKHFKSMAKKHDVSDSARKYLNFREEQTKGLTAFPKQSSNFSNNVISTAEEALKAQSEEYSYSEKEVNKFEERRKQIELDKKLKDVQSTPTFQSPFHQAIYLTESSLTRELAPIDKAFLHDFRRKNKACVSALNTILAKSKPKGETK